jgi:MoaA/NifB/PqqE/SkfB family radical SAM enzyme
VKTLSEIKRKYHFATYNLTPFRAPLFITHMTKRLLSAAGLKKGFRIIDLALSYACNLKCRHCSARILEQKNKTPLTLDEYVQVVKQAKQLDVLSWNVTGGEPLLVPWLDELISILEPRLHYISIQTNGMVLTPERAQRLRHLGVNCITMSLDSLDPIEHNEFRGASSAYQNVLAAIKNAQQAGLKVLIGGVVTHHNLRTDKLRRLIETVNRLGAIFLLIPAVPCGKWQGEEEMLLRDDDRGYLNRLVSEYPMTATDHHVGRNAIGCPAGTELLYITPYGDVTPCPFIHVSFGNVRESPLPEIVKRMHQVPYFNQYQNICIAAEDRKLHREVFSKLAAAKSALPVDAGDVFELGTRS